MATRPRATVLRASPLSRNRRSLVRLAGAALLVAAILVGVSAFRLSSGTHSRGGAEGAAPTEVAASTDVAAPTGVDPRPASAEPADAIAAAYAAACLGAAAPTVVGCGSGAIASSPGGPETAAPDSPSELVLVTSQTVAAGGQATVPLQFEGSATAAVIVVSQNASISASLGSATFVTSTFLDGSPLLAATVTSPADQPLILRNQGTTAQTVGVFVSITTARHLSVSAGSHFVHPGSALSVDVRLSSPVGNEVPSAALVDGSGNRTTIPLTSAGPGHWTGQIASPPPGLNRIIAWTSQNGLRLAGDIVEVTSGGAWTGRSASN